MAGGSWLLDLSDCGRRSGACGAVRVARRAIAACLGPLNLRCARSARTHHPAAADLKTATVSPPSECLGFQTPRLPGLSDTHASREATRLSDTQAFRLSDTQAFRAFRHPGFQGFQTARLPGAFRHPGFPGFQRLSDTHASRAFRHPCFPCGFMLVNQRSSLAIRACSRNRARAECRARYDPDQPVTEFQSCAHGT